ncbi:hypothetical protein C8A05DRAFT_43640 [Staphylotrichum tortipilum]|uniref:CFEM domain-containing protein n=1 Tax=Staphylotrichum tortipilum TaxID=2831512 RepID=A0AAN6RU34_9PEZI|nr:hypothetical protein C8A05DRAFT_43640 [Staphylotrichum longicolle]
MRAILGFALGLLTVVAPTLVAAEGMDVLLQALPKCAGDCFLDSVARSACATNQTAACTCNDSNFKGQMTQCVMANCTVKQSLATMNITSAACGAPVRDRAGNFDTGQIIFAVITACIVLTRLGFEVFVVHNLAPDDYMFLALALIAAPSVAFIHHGTAPNGGGRDIWTLTPQQITNFLFYFYLQTISYFINVTLIKLCLLLFYLRIFPSEIVRRLLWGTLVFTVLYGITFFFLATFQCSPVRHFWLHWDGEHQGICLNLSAIGWANAAFSIALDFWMLAIPLSQLRTLTLHWKKKVGVGVMFFVGTFVTVVSIIRVKALITLGMSSNITWDNHPVTIWSMIELNVGIICICMPTLRLLLVRLFPKLGRGGTSYINRYQHHSGGAQGLSGRGARMGQGRTGQGRTVEDSTSTLKSDGAQSGSSVVLTTMGVKPPGMCIVRQQTYAVEYDD